MERWEVGAQGGSMTPGCTLLKGYWDWEATDGTGNTGNVPALWPSTSQSAPSRAAEMVVERKEKGKQADEKAQGELTDDSVTDIATLIGNWYLGWEGVGGRWYYSN